MHNKQQLQWLPKKLKVSNETNISKNKPLRFIIAGGGTGGHIFPAIAIANAIRAIEPGAKFLFVGAKGKMEMEKVPAAGYNIRGIDIAGFNRSSLLKNISLPFKMMQSFFQVSNIIKEFKPNAVIGVGGYSSFPVLRYAQTKGIKTFIHESNSFAGKSNILLGKKATGIFVAWPGMEKFFPSSKIKLTGNPIRRAIVENKVSREAGINLFLLDPNKQTVLSVGGSLGAQGINEALEAGLPEFEKNNLQLIWQTGKAFFERAKAAAEKYANVHVTDFITHMEYGYRAADMVISRSGAMAMAELCVADKPVVFVPYPFAAEDHQTVNAKTLVDKGAALMVANSNAKQELVSTVLKLAKDEGLQKQLKKNIEALGISNADEIIAQEILKEVATA